ncbi:hypothetical protein LguiB_012603 [Lonicera macranthoides]
MAEEKEQQHNTEEDQYHSDSDGICRISFQNFSSCSPSCHGDSKGTAAKRQQNVQANPSPKFIAKPKSSSSGQNGQPEDEVEIEETKCSFCGGSLKVGKEMFVRKCDCPHDNIFLVDATCMNTKQNEEKRNEICGGCKKKFQDIRMTLHRAPATRKRSNWFAAMFKVCVCASSN